MATFNWTDRGSFPMSRFHLTLTSQADFRIQYAIPWGIASA